MHRDVSRRISEARQHRRESYGRRRGVRACNFDIADYVFRGAVLKGSGRKVAILWTRPPRVSRVLSDHLYELEDLLNGKLETVHGSQIRNFGNSGKGIDQGRRNYLHHQRGQYCIVDEFLDLWASAAGPQVLVRYDGFSDEEPAWMALREMQEDVPGLLSGFLDWLAENGTSRRKQIALSC